jgi:hypothetical protein
MPGFSDRAGSTGHSHNATDDLAFRLVVRRRHPELLISRLNSPAYAYPCQRFADALTNANA